jgi:hypothetical protein
VPHTALHDAIADAAALADIAVEREIDERAAGVVRLLADPELRDETIWRRAFIAAEEGGAPVAEDDWDDPFLDLLEIGREGRDFRWTSIWSVAVAAAQAQWDAEHILRPLWEALQAGGLAVMEAAGSVPRPLSAEARRGPGRSKFDAAKQKRMG